MVLFLSESASGLVVGWGVCSESWELWPVSSRCVQTMAPAGRVDSSKRPWFQIETYRDHV